MRWLCLAALAATATVLAGCGGVGVSGASEATGNQLAVYSSLPLQGPAAASSAEIVDGERLTLVRGHRPYDAFDGLAEHAVFAGVLVMFPKLAIIAAQAHILLEQ